MMTMDQSSEFPCRSLDPIDGFDLAGTDTLWNPPLTTLVASGCLADD